jgi:hypothetical protein
MMAEAAPCDGRHPCWSAHFAQTGNEYLPQTDLLAESVRVGTRTSRKWSGHMRAVSATLYSMSEFESGSAFARCCRDHR